MSMTMVCCGSFRMKGISGAVGKHPLRRLVGDRGPKCFREHLTDECLTLLHPVDRRRQALDHAPDQEFLPLYLAGIGAEDRVLELFSQRSEKIAVFRFTSCWYRIGADLLGQELERVNATLSQRCGERAFSIAGSLSRTLTESGGSERISARICSFTCAARFLSPCCRRWASCFTRERKILLIASGDFILYPVRVHLPVLEVIPEIKDLEILLLPARQP